MRLDSGGRWFGDEVMLRQLRPADAESVWTALSVEGFGEGLVEDPPTDLRDIESRLDTDLRRWHTGEAFSFAVTESDVFVGRADLRPDPHVNEALNLGFWIVQSRWGHGLATDAARVALRIAFEELAATEVWAGAASWNDASHAVLRKLMVHREHRDRGFQKAGRWVPNERYSLSEAQWLQLAGHGRQASEASG